MSANTPVSPGVVDGRADTGLETVVIALLVVGLAVGAGLVAVVGPPLLRG